MTATNAAVEVGDIVRFSAPGSRNTDGETRIIPAVVLRQWPDGSLQLYALHFEGPFLVNAIARDAVEMVFRGEFDRLDRLEELRRKQMTELEDRVAVIAQELDTLQQAVLEMMRATGRTTAPANAAH